LISVNLCLNYFRTLAAKRTGKKILKITGILLGILFVLLTGFHFWFKANAKEIIEEMVASESKGKLKLKIGKMRFSYFSKKIELEKAVFYNTDTVSENTAYRFSVDKINLQAKSILPIVFKKRILIDSLTLLNPHITVTRLRANAASSKKEKKDVSIAEEMGKIYTSIQDALQVLKVKNFQINDGTFTLFNKITPGQLPVIISNIFFHIDNLEVNDDTQASNKKILFSDNIILRTNNQDILFPDGRHRLSFSRFNINLKKKLVEFDSCTIAATRGDSSRTSFNVFFDKLLLTNINFDTLYKSEVIKADSVYCVSPKFNLEVELGRKKGGSKNPPKLEDIVKQLTGDLQLANVIVTNADFNINTIKDGNPSSFTFSNNNFEIKGLQIDQSAPRALQVKSFAMAIRNYENFIKDSTYSIRFDSIVFKNDQITLSNFLFNTLEAGKIKNTFSIPQFNLQGLSWDELVFEKRLKAEQAIMFSPLISYTTSNSPFKKEDKQNIFQSLSTVNEFMDLQYLDIADGIIDLKLKNNILVKLEKADVSIQSNSLLTSTKVTGIKNSLTSLKFKKGMIQAGNMTILLDNIHYVGKNGQFGAGNINVRDKEKKIDISLQEVAVKKMQVNEVTGSVFADGVQWQKADVILNSLSGGKKGNSDAPIIDLKNVRGANTAVNATVGGKKITTTLEKIFLIALIKKGTDKLLIDGLAITGKQLQINDNQLTLSIQAYDVVDNSNSSFRQIIYKNNNGKAESDIFIPSLTLIPHIQPLLNGAITLDAINVINPVINMNRFAVKNVVYENRKNVFPKIEISEIRLAQPSINFSQVRDSGTTTFSWQAEKNGSNFLQGVNLHTNAGITSVSNLNFYLTNFMFTNQKGKKFNTGEAKVSAQLKNIEIIQDENLPVEWTANISNFNIRDFRLDSMGKLKNSLVLNSGLLTNFNVSSSTLLSLEKLAAANTAFQLKHLTGTCSNTNTNLKWQNAGFTRTNNIFSADSFSMIPVLEKDSFVARQKYQADYITLKSGAINISQIDIDGYIKNKTLTVGMAAIDKFHFTDFRDKQLPFNPGIIKPLTANLIKKIPRKISVTTLLLSNAFVEYTETNEKTKAPGTIPITRMNVRALNLKNYNLLPTDSLTILATGYLMDTAWIQLRVKESYTDSLGGFLMTVKIKPADLTILNPVLIPLASAKIESGYLDTLSMRATGREYLTMGEMKMFYHDLKIRVLKNSDTTTKSFRTRLLNLIIKNKNTSRTGNVFFIRNRDRSAINYLIKIALSGMASSVGVKSNKKMMRKYKKELEERKLPPVDFE
jgi:hypothetical protein